MKQELNLSIQARKTLEENVMTMEKDRKDLVQANGQAKINLSEQKSASKIRSDCVLLSKEKELIKAEQKSLTAKANGQKQLHLQKEEVQKDRYNLLNYQLQVEKQKLITM
eukprot:13613519-Ditylum_brightwellii.AAC.1